MLDMIYTSLEILIKEKERKYECTMAGGEEWEIMQCV